MSGWQRLALRRPPRRLSRAADLCSYMTSTAVARARRRGHGKLHADAVSRTRAGAARCRTVRLRSDHVTHTGAALTALAFAMTSLAWADVSTTVSGSTLLITGDDSA